MTDISPWLLLSAVPGVGLQRFLALVKAFGSPQAAMATPLSRLMTLPRMDEKTARAIRHHRDRAFVEQQQTRMTKVGAGCLVFTDEDYPERLKAIYDPPPFMFLRGRVQPDDDRAVAIVGSRLATSYGKAVAEQLARELAQQGVTIVSGMARGIDTVAHRAALACGGRTLAVLGSGVDRPYPSENRALLEEIAGQGAVLSEFPMGTAPDAGNFPRRNRIISGLSLGVVIVEAGLKSGALLTAGFALDQNREVFAVPGNINAQRSAGTNRLIKNGLAKLIQSVDDILEELGPALGMTEPVAAPPQQLTLLPDEERLYKLLDETPRHIDWLSETSHIPPSQALPILLSLELMGVVRQLVGKQFVRTR